MARLLNPANLVTAVRVVLTPYIASLIFTGQHVAALVVFFIAALSDGIDGLLARRWASATAFGAYLDPIADKVLLSTVYICLALAGSLPWWFVALVFGRDFLILAASGLALVFTDVRKFPPSVWGKLSTFLQIVTAIAWMVRNAWPGVALDSIARALIWLATAATVWSGLHYGWRGLRLARTA